MTRRRFTSDRTCLFICPEDAGALSYVSHADVSLVSLVGYAPTAEITMPLSPEAWDFEQSLRPGAKLWVTVRTHGGPRSDFKPEEVLFTIPVDGFPNRTIGPMIARGPSDVDMIEIEWDFVSYYEPGPLLLERSR
jgi:hypothetical protein